MQTINFYGRWPQASLNAYRFLSSHIFSTSLSSHVFHLLSLWMADEKCVKDKGTEENERRMWQNNEIINFLIYYFSPLFAISSHTAPISYLAIKLPSSFLFCIKYCCLLLLRTFCVYALVVCWFELYDFTFPQKNSLNQWLMVRHIDVDKNARWGEQELPIVIFCSTDKNKALFYAINEAFQDEQNIRCWMENLLKYRDSFLEMWKYYNWCFCHYHF